MPMVFGEELDYFNRAQQSYFNRFSCLEVRARKCDMRAKAELSNSAGNKGFKGIMSSEKCLGTPCTHGRPITQPST